MSKTFFPYVEDEVFLSEVKSVFDKIESSLDKIETDLHDNVIDPFSAIFDSVGNNISFDEWVGREKSRQLQKTLQNAIGYFHQKILGSVDGWRDPGNAGGFDSENDQLKVIAEIKNKWNTMNSSSEAETYDKMSDFLDERKGYTGYVVIIIPRTPARFNKPFKPSKRDGREDLLTVDGATYYQRVTGDKDALLKLFNGLTEAIKVVRKDNFNFERYIDLFHQAYGH